MNEWNVVMVFWGVFILALIIFGGYVIFVSAGVDCGVYESQGYETKVVWSWNNGNECWIKSSEHFVPLKKWLSIDVNLRKEMIK